jgi:ABC-2 type transport system permease protein
MVSLLIKYRLLTTFSMFQGGKGLGRGLLILFAMAAVMFAIINMAIGIFLFAKESPEIGARVLENLVVFSFHGMFLFLLFWGLSMAVNSIFFSNDLPLLLTMPIKHKDIFVFKTIESTLLNTRVSLLFLIPFLVIYGLYHNAVIPYYIIIVAVVFFMGTIPCSLGIILASFLTRKVSRSRLKNSLTVVGSLIGVGIWAFMNQFSGRYSSESADFGSNWMKTSSLATKPAFNFMPSGWAFKVSQSAVTGDWNSCLLFLGILLAVSIALGYLALKLTSAYYAGGVSEEIAAPSVSAGRVIDFRTGGSPVMAHIKRDLILFSREPGVMMQNGIFLLFLLLIPFFARKDDFGKFLTLPISPVSVIFAAFLGGQVSSRLMGLERLGFWKNLVIPEGRRQTLIAKVIWGLALITIGVCLVGAIHLSLGRVKGAEAIFLMIAFAWIGFALGLPIGLFFTDFKWDHPKRMLKGGGGFIYALVLMVSSMALFALAEVISRYLSRYINTAVVMFALALGFLVISLVISFLRLANMEWTPDV